VTRTASISGRSPKATPGALCRFGPTKENGLARSDQTGSTSRFTPAIWISTLAWPISATRKPSTHAGGLPLKGLGKRAGHSALPPPNCHFRRSVRLLSGIVLRPGAKKRVPSK
jgi:hypothetical protein